MIFVFSMLRLNSAILINFIISFTFSQIHAIDPIEEPHPLDVIKSDTGINKPNYGNSPIIQSNSLKQTASFKKLIDDPKCTADIKRICGKRVSNFDNFDIINCIQNQERDDSALLNHDCHHVMWTLKYNITQSSQLQNILQNMCKSEESIMDQCSLPNSGYGNLASCIIQSLDEITDENCKQLVIRLASITFSDYHLVQHVTANCKNDIEQFQCGRIQTVGSAETHSQGLTLECLSRHTKLLDKNCKHEILRLVELQSEDFHLDRALYFACREDREYFCPKVRAGSGKVYKCLIKNQNDRRMTQKCIEQLQRRESLIVQDYKVSRSLVKGCKKEIKENHCKKGTLNDDSENKLSKILVCLQGALRKGIIDNGECRQEIINHRRMLLTISPKIVNNCQNEIKNSCSGVNGGKKLHCLMQLYKNKRSIDDKAEISIECQRSLEEVMKETDLAEDWRVDPVLYDACLPVVQNRCKDIRGGEGRIIRCLMRQMNNHFMTESCASALLEIQYFVSRDWKLDPQLYFACKNDSVKFCHAEKNWIDRDAAVGADGNILVLPCLFRYAYHPSPELRLTSRCTNEVRRVMHERSAYVALHPQIEIACLNSLSVLCSEKTGPGEEMLCLQNNLENLDGDCRHLIANYTQAETQDVGLNNLVETHCADVIDQLCGNLPSDEIEKGGILDCLVRSKSSQMMQERPKCKAVVENFQLVMLKDISFTGRFKTDCQSNIRQFCKKAPRDVRSKLDCLADVAMTEVLNGTAPMLHQKCRLQMRRLLKETIENTFKFDPKLLDACSSEIDEFCGSERGGGKVLECLRKKPLNPECRRLVFKWKQQESTDPLTDVVLMNSCKQMISSYCDTAYPDQLFKCLKAKKDSPNFDMKCREVIVSRMVERSKDVRLNPFLFKVCRKDLIKFCTTEYGAAKNLKLEKKGKVLECLKNQLSMKKLSSKCERRVIQMTRNSALNYKLNPVLKEKCGDDLVRMCRSEQDAGSEKGEVEECLKMHFEKKELTESCSIHVSELLGREKVDIHADPLLYQVCSIDDSKFCSDRVGGTHLACLYDRIARHPETLEVECKEKLIERREMFKVAMKVVKFSSNPESFNDFVEIVRSSPQRNYFIIVLLTVLGIIFLVGLTCGRVSRKTRAILKNR